MNKLFSMLLCGAMLVSFSACENNEPNGDSTTNGGTTGTHKGYEWVDLGLSSGTRWATCNVAATSPEEYGEYFAWGEVTPALDYSIGLYLHSSGHGQMIKYCTNSDDGKVDNKTIFEPEDDAATANWGDGWRMPTIKEFQELVDECTWTWTYNYNEAKVKGCIVTGPNGNSIFLPAAGLKSGRTLYSDGVYGSYWSSSLCEDYSRTAYGLTFKASDYDCEGAGFREDGYTVRPVYSPK